MQTSQGQPLLSIVVKERGGISAEGESKRKWRCVHFKVNVMEDCRESRRQWRGRDSEVEGTSRFCGDGVGVKGTAQGVSSEKKKGNHPKTGEKQMEMKKIEGLWKLKRRKTEFDWWTNEMKKIDRGTLKIKKKENWEFDWCFFCSKVLPLMLKVQVCQSCPTLYDPMNYTVHGILQVRILEWIAVTFSRGSSQPRDWTQVFPHCR